MSLKALTNISESAETLLSTVREIAIPNSTRQIESHLEAILSSYARTQVDIDLICYGESFFNTENPELNQLNPNRKIANSDNPEKQDFSSSLEQTELCWHQYDWRMPINKSSGLQNSAILVAYVPEGDIEQVEEWKSHFCSLISDYSGLLVWADESIGNSWLPSDEEKRNFIDTLLVPRNTEGGIMDFIEENYSSARLQVFSLAQSVLALEANNTIFGLILDQEERNNKGKKVLSHVSETRISSKDSGSSKNTKLIANFKNELSTQQNGFLKGIEKKYSEYFKPMGGAFRAIAEAKTKELHELQEIPGTKQNSLKIPENFILNFIDDLKGEVSDNMLADIRSMNDLLKESIKDIQNKLEQEANQHLSFSPDYMTTDSMNSLLSGLGFIDRNYEGSVTKKGAYEYFMAMRKYQMLVFMMASSLGLTFIKNIRLYMIPLTIVLMGVGAYNVTISVKKEREEGQEKELNKAREHLLAIAKQISSEVNRYWVKQLQEHVKSQFASLLSEAEQCFKQHQEKMGVLEEEEKINSQRANAGFEMMEKKLETARKNRSSWERTLNRLKTDLRLTYNQVARDERAKERELRRRA